MTETERSLMAHYDARPEYYSPLDTNNVQWLFRQLLPDATPNMRLLDLGCGDGRLWPAWAAYVSGAIYAGVDYSEERIRIARKRHGRRFACSSINTYTPASWARPDVVALFEVLEHLEEPSALLDRWREQAIIIGSVPLRMEYHAHLQVYESLADVQDRLGVEVVVSSDKHAFFRTSPQKSK